MKQNSFRPFELREVQHLSVQLLEAIDCKSQRGWFQLSEARFIPSSVLIELHHTCLRCVDSVKTKVCLHCLDSVHATSLQPHSIFGARIDAGWLLNVWLCVIVSPTVVSTVLHSHQLTHTDLKPENIMLVDVDSDACYQVPRVTPPPTPPQQQQQSSNLDCGCVF